MIKPHTQPRPLTFMKYPLTLRKKENPALLFISTEVFPNKFLPLNSAVKDIFVKFFCGKNYQVSCLKIEFLEISSIHCHEYVRSYLYKIHTIS